MADRNEEQAERERTHLQGYNAGYRAGVEAEKARPSAPSLVSGEGDDASWRQTTWREIKPGDTVLVFPWHMNAMEFVSGEVRTVRTIKPGRMPMGLTVNDGRREIVFSDGDPERPKFVDADDEVLVRAARPVSVSTGGDERLNEVTAAWEAAAERVTELEHEIEQMRAAPVPSTGGEGQALTGGSIKPGDVIAVTVVDVEHVPEANGVNVFLETGSVSFGVDELVATPASASVPEDAEGVLEDAIHAAAGVHDEIDVAAAAAVLADRGWRLSPVPGVDAEAALGAAIETVKAAGLLVLKAHEYPMPSGVDAEGERAATDRLREHVTTVGGSAYLQSGGIDNSGEWSFRLWFDEWEGVNTYMDGSGSTPAEAMEQAAGKIMEVVDSVMVCGGCARRSWAAAGAKCECGGTIRRAAPVSPVTEDEGVHYVSGSDAAPGYRFHPTPDASQED